MENVANKTQTIKLSLLQRLDLVSLLPKAVSLVRLIVIKDLKKKISITQKDIEAFDIKDNVIGNKIITSFSIEKTKDGADILDFEFTNREISELKQILKESNLVTENLLDLCYELKIA